MNVKIHFLPDLTRTKFPVTRTDQSMAPGKLEKHTWLYTSEKTSESKERRIFNPIRRHANFPCNFGITTLNAKSETREFCIL